MSRRNIVQTLALLLFLVVLPLGSWYYLKKGIDYRIEKIRDMGEFAQLDDKSLQESFPDQWPPEDWTYGVGVWAFVPEEDALRTQFQYYLKELTSQFEAKDEEVTFFSVQTPEAFRAAPFEWPEDDKNYASLMYLETEDPESLAKNMFKIPLDDLLYARNPFLVLTDSLMVKRYYHVDSKDDMGRLVEHIALLLPQESEVVELIREAEK